MSKLLRLFENQKIKYVVFIILALMAAVSVCQGARNSVIFSQDFQYDAAKAFTLKINPYEESLSPSGALDGYHLEEYYLQMEANQFPSLLMLLIPFTFLKPLTARYVWLICNLLFTGLIIWLLRKTFFKNMGKDCFVVLTLLMLASTPYRNQLGVGQHTLFAFCFFLFAVYFSEKEKGAIPTIFCLCVSYFKYTLTVPLALYFIYKKKYKEIAASVGIHIVLTFVAALWLQESFLNMILEPLKVSSALLTEGGIDFGYFIGLFLGPSKVAYVLALLVMIFLFYLTITMPEGLDGELISVLCLWSLIITYHRTYDFFVLVLVSVFFLGKAALQNKKIEIVKLLYFIVLILVFFVLRIFSESIGSKLFVGSIYYIFTVFLTALLIEKKEKFGYKISLPKEVKSLTFYSNYFNHHQRALCDEWYKRLGDGFTFVETMPMEAFRKDMGWEKELPPYVLQAFLDEESEEKARLLGLESDLVIIGTAPEYYIEPRRKSGKLIFRYSERPLKEGFIKFFIPRLTKKYLYLHVRNKRKNIYVLGASAFASLDFHKMFHSYPDKCYKFGYFPEHIEANINELMMYKEIEAIKAGAPTILWEGRLLKLKRADLLIKAAAILKEKGYDFKIKIVGEGKEREHLLNLIERLHLKDDITITGFVSPKEARELMKRAKIYVSTSNFYEGWGSVIYESLDAGCAVIASHACGATPWLIKDQETGLVFESGNAKNLAEKIEACLKDDAYRRRLGEHAYKQMDDLWNPSVAAKRVIQLAEANEEEKPGLFENGPCSKAEYIRNDWYKAY